MEKTSNRFVAHTFAAVMNADRKYRTHGKLPLIFLNTQTAIFKTKPAEDVGLFLPQQLQVNFTAAEIVKAKTHTINESMESLKMNTTKCLNSKNQSALSAAVLDS